MNIKQSAYDQILADISVIRRSLEKTADPSIDVFDIFKLGSAVALHALALSCSLTLLTYELVSGGAYSRSILASIHSPVLRNNYILSAALILIALVGVAYGFLWFYAKRHNEQLHECFTKNMQYMANLSFLSDLLTKYLLLVGLILAGGSAYIGPALSLFTADYLLQGRFFAMRKKLRIALGLACLIVTIVLWASGTYVLLWPALAFNICALTSLIELILLGRNLHKADK